MTSHRIEKFYSKIPTSQKKILSEFEKSHIEKSLIVDQINWHYYDSGRGEEVLLLLHGGFTDFDMWIHQIIDLEKDYRIIAPSCPELQNARMKTYSDAIYEILKAENIQNVNLMGYSEGGLIAQCFLRDHFQMIKKVILAHTFPPSRESSYYQHDFRLFRILPPFMTEGIFKILAIPDKEELQHDSTEWIEWFKGYFKELKSKLTKKKILTHIDLMIDFVKNYSFQPDDLSSWNGKILITVSEDDVVLRFFEEMKKIYPYAENHIFKKGLGAHSIGLISPQVFNSRIREFLDDQEKVF